MNRYKLLCYVFLLLFIGTNLQGQAPSTISFQGFLSDETGKAKPDGEYTLTVNLYEAMDDETALWSSGPVTVSTSGGVFNLLLGDDGQPELPMFLKPYYAGIEMNKQELIDRIAISSVPYSLYSQRAKVAESLLIPELPVGSVISYAGMPTSIPENWMICSGKTMISKEYPELFEVIGTSWGDGSSDRSLETDFNLPDLRGQFLRGVDASAGIDPDAGYRASINPGGNTGDSVGTYQNDAVKAIQDKPFGGESSFSSVPNIQTEETIFSLSAGSETRPKNASVYFIIKVK